MKKEQLSQAVNDIDMHFLEEADNFKKGKRVPGTLKWLAAAASVALLVLAGEPVLNYATSEFDSVKSYFEGEPELYMEQILSRVTSVSNEELELRVEGVIADEHICYMIVSFIGLTDEMQERLLRGDLSEQELFEQYAVLSDGRRVEHFNSGSNTHIRNTVTGEKQAISMIPDAHATYIITYAFPDRNLSEIQTVGFSFEGLRLEVDANQYITPTYGLQAENGKGRLSDAYISSIGFGFTYHLDAPITDEDIENMTFDCKINLIRADGTVMTETEMAEQKGYSQSYGFATGDTETYIEGTWEKGHLPQVIDLEEYCGLQVNGVNYYFVKE